MIHTQNLKICYEAYTAVKDFNIEVIPGEVLSIIGPNGSGKSTVLRAIARLYPQKEGLVYLDGTNIRKMKSKSIAQKLSILSQYQTLPPDITVEEIVGRGRLPHHSLFAGLSEKDKKQVAWALEETRLTDYKERSIHSLSGGEKQRAYIAMALAQQPQVLLLDEPTTYLDICFQFEILELVKRLNQKLGLTIIMVLHDINQAARYSSRIAVMQDGELKAIGKPWEVITEDFMKEIYHIHVKISRDEVFDTPYLIPIGMTR